MVVCLLRIRLRPNVRWFTLLLRLRGYLNEQALSGPYQGLDILSTTVPERFQPSTRVCLLPSAKRITGMRRTTADCAFRTPRNKPIAPADTHRRPEQPRTRLRHRFDHGKPRRRRPKNERQRNETRGEGWKPVPRVPLPR